MKFKPLKSFLSCPFYLLARQLAHEAMVEPILSNRPRLSGGVLLSNLPQPRLSSQLDDDWADYIDDGSSTSSNEEQHVRLNVDEWIREGNPTVSYLTCYRCLLSLSILILLYSILSEVLSWLDGTIDTWLMTDRLDETPGPDRLTDDFVIMT